jgi:dipeptidyl aminopeptidase/acylaminoacyl peptidase
MTRGMQPEDVFSFRTVTDPRLSPDGTKVAFVVNTNSSEDDEAQTTIWVTSADGSMPARQFTSGPKDTSPRWSPDGRYLAFVAKRPSPGSGQAAKDVEAQIHLAPLDGGDPHPLTEAPYGASQPGWSPDGATIVYVAQTGDWTPPAKRSPSEKNAPRVVRDLRYRFDGLGFFDERRSHVFTVAVESGRTRQVTRGDWNDSQPAWSPDGAHLVFISDRNRARFDRPRPDVWLVAATGGRAKRLTRGSGQYGMPEFSPDGRFISFLGREADDGNSAANDHLYVLDAEGGGPRRSLSELLDRPAFGLIWPSGRTHGWIDDRNVYFLATDHGARHLYRAGLDPGTGVPARVLGGDRQIIGVDLRGERVAFASVWPSLLPEACVADLGHGTERVVSDVNAELRKTLRLAPLKRVRTNGIESFVVHPLDERGRRPRPTVVEIHGGPHGSHPQSVMLPLYQCLAAAGYVVCLPNPRGSQSYGEEFSYASVGDWGGGDFADIMGVVDALVDTGVSDPERLYVAGYSYGGYMTGWAVGHTSRFKAACISAPAADLSAMVGTSDIPLFAIFEMGGATPWDRPDVYAKHSAITYLADVRTPVQLVHWEGDLRCPIGQSEAWFQGLKLLGREVEMVRYPGGFHIVRAPSQVVDEVKRHLDWFSSH